MLKSRTDYFLPRRLEWLYISSSQRLGATHLTSLTKNDAGPNMRNAARCVNLNLPLLKNTHILGGSNGLDGTQIHWRSTFPWRQGAVTGS